MSFSALDLIWGVHSQDEAQFEKDGSNGSNSTMWWWISACFTYLVSEFAFYLYFHWHLMPLANRLTPAEKYHDYPQAENRVQLFRRILVRLQRKVARRCAREPNKDARSIHQQVVRDFCLDWFELQPASSSSEKKPTKDPSNNPATRSPLLSMISTLSTSTASSASSTSGSSGSDSSDASSVQSDEDGTASSVASTSSSPTSSAILPPGLLAPWTVPGLHRRAANKFFAWAFFAKEHAHLTAAEQAGLEACFQALQELTGLVVESDDSTTSENLVYEPRRLTLENMQALHRPWAVYAMIASGQGLLRRVILPWLGFKQVLASNAPLSAWYRPAAKLENETDVCLFFHGIAPTGLLCYLPMLQTILGKRQKSMVMFENPSVSCQFHPLPHFDTVREEDMVCGVRDILSQLQLQTRRHSLTLMGHSFGSCPITWILRRRNQFEARINHVVLLDPVTLLLSEPTVMARFLYERTDDRKHIRLMVASELFTEYFLRRHFSWYNSELWLEDFCNGDTTQNNPQKWTIV